jgi:Rod binding domain-containing protein
MNISALPSAPVRAPEVSLDKLQDNPQLTDTEKVTEVGRQFEAVLLRQILTEATKNIFGSGEKSESATNSIYQDLITNSLADNMSRSGGLGLGRVLAKQLQHECKTAPATLPGAAKV